MTNYKFWETNTNPITGWKVSSDQLSNDITRMNQHLAYKRNFDTQIDLEDMINDVVQLETFNTNQNEQ